VLFAGLQSVVGARATVMEWLQQQSVSGGPRGTGDHLTAVPVRSCLTRMFGRSNALLDPSCKLVEVRNAINTVLGLMGYDVDTSILRTPCIEVMRPIVQDLRDIRRRIEWNHARSIGAV
jgi:hypothetical protein